MVDIFKNAFVMRVRRLEGVVVDGEVCPLEVVLQFRSPMSQVAADLLFTRAAQLGADIEDVEYVCPEEELVYATPQMLDLFTQAFQGFIGIEAMKEAIAAG